MAAKLDFQSSARSPSGKSSPRFRIRAVRTSAGTGLEGFKAHAVFQEINKKLQEEGEQFVKKIGGVFAFKVKDGPNGQEATWIVDVKNGSGCVHNDADKKADCTIAMSDTDLLALMTGKMNPQTVSIQTISYPIRHLTRGEACCF
uniref:Sterol carrier protein 2b n=1 Tax=Poecilia latipinna TaxID=48699 RepID=A0A3B3UMJ5_9TELE